MLPLELIRFKVLEVSLTLDPVRVMTLTLTIWGVPDLRFCPLDLSLRLRAVRGVVGLVMVVVVVAGVGGVGGVTVVGTAVVGVVSVRLANHSLPWSFSNERGCARKVGEDTRGRNCPLPPIPRPP